MVQAGISLRKMKRQINRSHPIPRHLGIIMDGNGRWAQAWELPRSAGHNAGVQKAREMNLRSKEEFQESVILALDAHERLLAGGEKKKRKDVRTRDWEKDDKHEFAFTHDRVKHRRASVKLPERPEEENPLPRDFTPSLRPYSDTRRST